MMDTILQVVSDELVLPRKPQPRTPGDLETICLKCLQKEPGKAATRVCAWRRWRTTWAASRQCGRGDCGRGRWAGWSGRGSGPGARPAAARACWRSACWPAWALVRDHRHRGRPGLRQEPGTGAAALGRATEAETEARDEAEEGPHRRRARRWKKQKEARDEAEKARVAEGKACGTRRGEG